MKAEAHSTIVSPAAAKGSRRRSTLSCSAGQHLRTSKVFLSTLQCDCMVGVMLDVHRLRVFRSVVASGSIQAAAVNLGYTASAVSQHVSALQRETGLTLVSR